jgi:DNA-binding response OmpR family regulator
LKKILIIDDEDKLRNLLTKIISYEGFDVHQAADCKTALKKMFEISAKNGQIDHLTPD